MIHCRHGKDCNDLKNKNCPFLHPVDKEAAKEEVKGEPKQEERCAAGFGCHDFLIGACTKLHFPEDVKQEPKP